MPRNRSVTLPQPVFDEPTFNEGVSTPDPTRFSVPHPSDAQQYRQVQALLYEDVVGIPTARGTLSDLYELASALGPHGPEVVASIRSAGQVVFHAVGDIGASTAAKYPGEIRVSDQITQDCQTSPAADRPAFLYLLGDVVYDFGEAQYYFDQFYEPYRNYPAPIFAIPGNHDSFVVPGTAPADVPLVTFQRNFCATEPTVTPEAGSLHRTAMTQPGVYFTLDAPFVRILGLFSNALEDPGVLSSEGGKWAAVPDVQLDFLAAQLARVKSDGFAGALILAVHHPPFSYAPPAGGTGSGGDHSGNSRMLADIDRACTSAGVYPHVVLAGHAHNYQRYTRAFSLGGEAVSVPFIVCGDGGHDVSALVQAKLGSAAAEPADGADVSYLDPTPVVGTTRLTLERHDDHDYGFLRITANPTTLAVEFHQVGGPTPPNTPADQVTVDLASHSIVGAAPAARRGAGGGRGVSRGSRRPPTSAGRSSKT